MDKQANHTNTYDNALPDVEGGFSGYFVVAFVDMLGTEARNTEIKAQPEFPAAMLEQEVAKVKAFQSDFYATFEGAALTEKKLKLLRPENLTADFETLQGNEIKSYAFSDSLIFFASLNTQQGRKVPVSSCYSLLTALVCAQLWSLARGVPFRGGVEVGRAAVFNGNQILGPALSDAVKLERQAQFPRILIGKGFRNYLQINRQLPPEPPASGANRAFAEICISHICESDEPSQLHEPDEAKDEKTHVLSLDVRSEFIADLMGEPHQALLKKARNFASNELQRFNGRDEKLAGRYRHLLNYLSAER